MKKGHFLRWIMIPLHLYLYLVCIGAVTAQELEKNYVIVGAFQHEKNAKEWVNYSRAQNFDAEYKKNSVRGLFYVYIYDGVDRNEALFILKNAWELENYSDAWIFRGNLENEQVVRSSSAEAQDYTETASNNDTSFDDNTTIDNAINDKSDTLPTEEALSQNASEEVRNNVIIDETDDSEIAEQSIDDLGDLTVFFNLFNAQNSEDVFGEVKIIDTERAKLIQTINSGEYVTLPDPKNGTGKLTLLVENFGYRAFQHEINFYEPVSDTSALNIDIIGDVKVYHFPLVRYHKGDIAIMYNVYFFIDAAVMRPESTYEVQRLLNMMKENPDYKIRIHGHTNGNSHGKIITVGDDKEFFALTDDDLEGYGSAKNLSEARAEVIKAYLEENGIAPERMEVKAWGGKRMLYDKHSNQAKNNVRVEIEILED